MSARKTYWHLESLHRTPTEYEIATTGLLYYPARGFEVETPAGDWYRRHQKGSPLTLADPDRFRDPRETTYPKYTALQSEREGAIDAVMEEIEGSDYDRKLPAAWVRTLSKLLPPLRYPAHALQMAAAYVGQMAPGSRIAIAALFQAADEMRRTQRLAYRMRLLQETHPQFGHDARQVWQEDPLWQPMRELLEKLLVVYDWGESFVAVNVVAKPMFDEFFMVHVAGFAERSGDPLLAKTFRLLHEDCRWHREWSTELVRLFLQERPAHADIIRGWIRRWHPLALRAVAALGPLFGGAGAVGPGFAAAMEGLHAACAGYWRSAGLLRPLE